MVLAPTLIAPNMFHSISSELDALYVGHPRHRTVHCSDAYVSCADLVECNVVTCYNDNVVGAMSLILTVL